MYPFYSGLRFYICVPLTALAILITPLAAQRSHLDVTVTDSTGAAIPGAHILVKSLATGKQAQGVAKGSGRASFPLPRGKYVLSVKAAGFQAWQRHISAHHGDERVAAVLKTETRSGLSAGSNPSSLTNLPGQQPPVKTSIQVTDVSGASVPGAIIQIGSNPCLVETVGQTDKSGNAVVYAPPGRQTIVVNMPGFATWSEQLDVAAGASQPLIVTLQVSATTSVVAIKPDVILFHGTILTGRCLGEGRPEVVSAIAMRGGEIQAVGSDADIKSLASTGTRLRDLNGAFVMPGLNDAHVHLGGAGQTRLHVDLTGSASLDEMLHRVQAKADSTAPRHWLTGGGWDHTLWASKTLPTRQDLDKVTGTHPALLERIDGHIAVANSAALKAAGITGKSTAPHGGAIDLDASGQPTGILRDTAMEEVEKVVPKPTTLERREGLELAIQDAVTHGLTSVQDNSEWQDFLVFETLEKEGKLPVRITEWLPFNDSVAELREHSIYHDPRDPMLHTGMLKGFMDGSLGSRTAALKAPYADDPANSGLARYDQTELNEMAVERAKAGFQIGFHAIGDLANTMALNAFAQSYNVCFEPQPRGSKCIYSVSEGKRDRIEHAQVVDPADIPSFAKLNVIASMQPNHLLTDMNWALDRIGPERAQYSYAWKAFLDAGVVVAFGTDYPVEPVTPFRGLYAAVTRANEAGTRTYFPERKLTRAQAIYAYTQGSAYAEFAEKQKGKLVPGYHADFIVLDRNLLTCPAPEILKIQVLETVVGGKTVYSSK